MLVAATRALKAMRVALQRVAAMELSMACKGEQSNRRNAKPGATCPWNRCAPWGSVCVQYRQSHSGSSLTLAEELHDAPNAGQLVYFTFTERQRYTGLSSTAARRHHRFADVRSGLNLKRLYHVCTTRTTVGKLRVRQVATLTKTSGRKWWLPALGGGDTVWSLNSPSAGRVTDAPANSHRLLRSDRFFAQRGRAECSI